jgi:hypothetical protein
MTKKNVVAEICLYGARRAGFDYLACYLHAATSRFTPNSQPDPTKLRYELLTDCIFRAQRELIDAGLSGTVAVFAPDGERFAHVELGECTYFGSMPWQPAPVVTISAEVQTAAEVP